MNRVLPLGLGLLAAAGRAVAAVTNSSSSSSNCKCFPGDACWPADGEWNALNTTVGGKLIATVPLGKPCHGSDFNNGTCEFLREEWQNPGLHMNNSASVMAPFFANESCDPFTAQSQACTLGNYVRYAVEVESADHVVAAINFAKQKNIRFVVRNTGHDYLGRSTGAGALSVWTHKLKDITFKTWNDEFYQGSAVKLGAGVQGFEAITAALAKGQTVVGGECPTVGISGGYTQGGGHSALSTNFGLSADNTLEWEVITADGKLVTASRTNNTSLYWALSGGGAGNWGVVLSMTVKTHPESYTSGATLAFYSTNNPTDTFYAGIDAFHAALPDLVAQGGMVVYYFTNTFFQIAPMTAWNKTKEEVSAMMAPLLASLDSLNVNYTSSVTQFDTYYDHYNNFFGPLPIGNIEVGIAQYGSRLIPASVVKNNASALSSVARFVAEQGVTWIGVGTDVSSFGGANAVLPAWRDALVHATLTTPWSFDPADWDKMLANQDLMTNTVVPAVEAVTPGSGAYLNEADFRQPNFKSTFFGKNYNALKCIKKKYDPEGFFYTTQAVLSDQWTIAADGRMCRA